MRDREDLGSAFKALCDHVAADLACNDYVSKKIGVKLRFDDFATVTRDSTLPPPIGDARSLRRAACSCIKQIDLLRTIRPLCIKVGPFAARFCRRCGLLCAFRAEVRSRPGSGVRIGLVC